MTDTTTSRRTSATTTEGSRRYDDTDARRARGVALIVGALVIVGLIETETIPYYWFPTLIGLTYLAGAAAGRSRGPLLGPGFVLTSVGVAAALWLRDGRSPDSFEFAALAIISLGLGGTAAALLTQYRGFSISALNVASPVLLFGVFTLLEQQMVSPFAGSTWVIAALFALGGAYELRPSPAPSANR